MKPPDEGDLGLMPPMGGASGSNSGTIGSSGVGEEPPGKGKEYLRGQ